MRRRIARRHHAILKNLLHLYNSTGCKLSEIDFNDRNNDRQFPPSSQAALNGTKKVCPPPDVVHNSSPSSSIRKIHYRAIKFDEITGGPQKRPDLRPRRLHSAASEHSVIGCRENSVFLAASLVKRAGSR